MKNLSVAILFLMLFGNSCKRDCLCTERACYCPELELNFTANAENNKNGSFTISEVEQFVLIRTQSDFSPIDSLEINFSDIIGSNDYNKYFRISASNFSNFSSFKDYNFLIINNSLGSIDTLSNFNYTEQMSSQKCNECDPCEDEYMTCSDYLDTSLEWNGNTRSEFTLHLTK